MSRWNDQFSTHVSKLRWDEIESLVPSLVKNVVVDADYVDEVRRLTKCLQHFGQLFESLDPELLPNNVLNQFGGPMQNLLTAIKSVIENDGGVAALQQANGHMDALLSTASSMSFEAQAGRTSQLDGFCDDSKRLIEGIRTAATAKVLSLNETVSSVEDQANEIAERIARIEKRQDDAKEEQGRQLESWRAQVEKQEVDRAKIYEEKRSEQDKQGVKLLAKLKKLSDDASTVYDAAVKNSKAGAYAGYAEQEKQAADWLRILAAVLLVLGVAALFGPDVKALFSSAVIERTPMHSIARAAWAFVLFAPSVYLAKESNRHRNNEMLNRRRELIIKTLGPYLALLNDPQKEKEIKIEVAKQIFSEDGVPTEKSLHQIELGMSKILDAIKRE